MPRRKVLATDTPPEKRSLSDLKKTPFSSPSARKKALKKIDSGVVTRPKSSRTAKKLSSPLLVKREPAAIAEKPKKANEKKSVQSKKNVSRVTVTQTESVAPTKKIPIRVSPDKKSRASSGKRTKQASAIPSPIQDSGVVSLPMNMSIRAREKALAILNHIVADSAKSAQSIAYVAGMCFLLLGASLALSPERLFMSAGSQAALVQQSLDMVLSSTTQGLPTPVQIRPVVSLLDSLPPVVQSVTQHKISVTHGASLRIRTINNGVQTPVQTQQLSPELYSFTLDSSRLGHGFHQILAVVESVQGGTLHEFPIGTFEVAHTAEQTIALQGGTPSSDGATSSATTTAPRVAPKEVLPAPERVNMPAAESATKLALFAPTGTLSGEVPVVFIAPFGTSYVEVIARRLQATDSIFLGRARMLNGQWTYAFNTRNIPNGEYTLTARTRIEGKDILSESVVVQIRNEITAAQNPATAPFREEASAAVTPEVIETRSELTTPDTDSESEALLPGRSLPNVVATEELPEEEVVSELSVDNQQIVRDILLQYQSDVRTIFNKYAVAKQSNDTVLLAVIEKEIEETKQAIIDDVLSRREGAIYIVEVRAALEERFQILRKQVDTFEELRRSASDGDTALDSDDDGVSDFDEINLYGTDAFNADTDGDGSPDGVEVMRGFNPLDASPEAIIRYESPKDVLALVEEELLKVEEVVPFVVYEGDENRMVQAEIRGRALPNSFVTLFIFSTPTIVTVRADETGAFVYRFEKELEDGEHEVYVAVTDNSGAIVARSNPFRFIKEAEAFTVVSEQSQAISETITTAPNSGLQYNVVGGLGILALGLILLMLSVTTRERNRLENLVQPHDLKPS